MTKRRDVVRLLEENGFSSRGGTNHEKFVHLDGRRTVVPRHSNVDDDLFKAIKRQAGLK